MRVIGQIPSWLSETSERTEKPYHNDNLRGGIGKRCGRRRKGIDPEPVERPLNSGRGVHQIALTSHG
jgi:hypothetical protein